MSDVLPAILVARQWIDEHSSAGSRSARSRPRSPATRKTRRKFGGSAFCRENLDPVSPGFVQALRDLGWVEGRNVRIETRGSDQAEQLPDLAADLVQQGCDLIVASGTGATRAAKQATVDIPIVFAVGGDPVARGLVDNMARPGGNLTGFALGIYDEKQLDSSQVGAPGSVASGLRRHRIGQSAKLGETRCRQALWA